jgi:Zn-finger nucleic acid-binding protein
MDEPDESAGALLKGMRVDLDIELKIDLDARIGCPRCVGVTLMRQQHPADHDLMTDKCPACGGVWLDFGELFELRTAQAGGEESKRDVKGLLGGLRG